MGYDNYNTSISKQYSQAYFDELLRMANTSTQLTNFSNHAVTVAGTDYLETKSQVNGLWNSLLNICFPTNEMHYVIEPEAECQRMGQKTSFFINFMDSNYTPWPRLAFEGKGGAMPTSSWENIQKQMLNYMAQKIGSAAGQACWCVAARGNEVKFWRYTTRFIGAQRMVPVGFLDGVVVDSNQNVGMAMQPFQFMPPPYPSDWPAIQAVLEYVAANVPVS